MRIVKVENGYETATNRANSRRCGQCPVRNRYGLCSVRAEVVAPNRPACRYGVRKMHSAQTLKGRAKKESQTKTKKETKQ